MKNDDFSIEEILNDVKRLTGESTETEKLWSLAEIDALLNDGNTEDEEAAVEETAEEIAEEVTEEVAEETGEETSEGAGQVSQDTGSINLKEFAMNHVIDADDGSAEASEVQKTADKTEPQDDMTEAAMEFDGNVEDFIDEFTDEPAIKPASRAEGKDDEAAEEETDIASQEQEAEAEYESESLEDNGDIEPLIDSVEQEEEPVSEDEQAEDDYVPGQISIEKTRVFNEIDVRAKKDDSIDHQIGNAKVIRTGEINVKGGMEHDPYRERFFNKPELSIEKTQDHRELIKDLPQKTIEKTGVIVKKPQFEKTGEDGLSPVPTLVDPADEYDAQHRYDMETQAGALHKNALEDDNQIMLEGFAEEEEVEILNEAQAEENLRKVRREKAKNFKLFPNLMSDEIPDYEEPETDEADDNEKTRPVKIGDAEADAEDGIQETEISEESQEAYVPEKKEKVRVAREFFGPKDAHAVYDIMLKDKSRKKLKFIVSAIGFAVLLISSAVTSFFSSFALFGDSATVYSAVNFIILAAVCAFNFDAFPEALEKAKKKKLTSATAVSLALAVGIIQSLVSFGFSELVMSGTHIYAAVALFPVLMINLADFIKSGNDLDNFLLINEKQGEFYAVKSVDDENTAFEIGRGLLIKEPDVRYNSKVNFPYKFVEMTKTVDPTEDVYRLALPVGAIAAIIVGVFSMIINKSIFVGVTSLTGVFLMAVPCAVSVALFAALRRINRTLNDEGGMVSGYEAVNNALEANAVAVDAGDLFADGEANIYGIKLFNSMRIDEAILYTAAVVCQSNGALSDVFDSIVLSNHDMLPPVESLAYEEKLGCSGWIYNYRVLVGNRDLLLKHNVEVQSKQEESRFTASGRQVVYLAVEGKVAAMFVVGYGADENVARSLRALEKNGINIVVRTTDANISEELVEQLFDLPKGIVKVISPVAGVMLSELTDTVAENEPCRVLDNGKLKSALNALVGALSLNEKGKISTVLQYIGVAIGILLMAMFSFTSGMSQAGAVQMILFEALWSLVVVLVPRLKR